MQFVNKLKSWLESLPLNQYSDEYNNWCFGNKKQKHIIHLHPYNTHADIEINNPQKHKAFLDKFNLQAHEWRPNNWLIIDLKTKKDYEIAKEIISLIINTNAPGRI